METGALTKDHSSSDHARKTAGDEGARSDTSWMAHAVDPDERLDRLSSLLQEATASARSHSVELYSRASARARVCVDGLDDAPTVHVGFEDGIAVRVAQVRQRCLGFAACAGTNRQALRWVVEQALRSSSRSSFAGWAEGRGHPLLDREPAPGLPAPSELSAWLDKALRAAARTGVRVGSAWVEAALTTESIAADCGLLASRERTRAWALAIVDGRPRSVGARTIDSLDTLDWARSKREPLTGSGDRFPQGKRPVVFLPEAAASLVKALVRVLQATVNEPRPEIGRGWRVKDDPLDPRALVGGSFDDAGFPTAEKLLWDGRQAVGEIDGAGHFRRASYRDPPVPMVTTLVLEASASGGEEPCVLVEFLRVHPLDPRTWVLEMSGRDTSGAPFQDAMLQVKPLDLLRRCAATMGEPRWFPRGVVTPAILLESLR